VLLTSAECDRHVALLRSVLDGATADDETRALQAEYTHDVVTRIDARLVCGVWLFLAQMWFCVRAQADERAAMLAGGLACVR
jgi:hypothetical protein